MKRNATKKAEGLFHLKVKTHSRCGRGAISSVSAAAYRGGTSLYDQRYGRRRTYSRKMEVIFSGVLLPEGAPIAFRDREVLWNACEAAEARIDARLFRELIIALPTQLSVEQNVELVTGYLSAMFVGDGLVASWDFHDLWSRPKGKPEAPLIHNPHIHVMLTTRTVDDTGFLGKQRAWDKADLVPIWRAAWASHCNHALAAAGVEVEIDHRSFAERGIDAVPTVHLGRRTAGNAKAWDRKRKHNQMARSARSSDSNSSSCERPEIERNARVAACTKQVAPKDDSLAGPTSSARSGDAQLFPVAAIEEPCDNCAGYQR